jgi:hypothetical protein
MKKIIIDGHGSMVQGSTFPFRTPLNNANHLFFFTRDDISINANFSNTLISAIVHDDMNSVKPFAKKITSNHDGIEVTEHRLYPINKDIVIDDNNEQVFDEIGNPVLAPLWDLDGYFLPDANNVNRFRIDNIPVITITRNNCIYFRLNYYTKPGDGNNSYLKLSSIITAFQHRFHNEELDFYWMACKKYEKNKHR